jgi:hypothetical protein
MCEFVIFDKFECSILIVTNEASLLWFFVIADFTSVTFECFRIVNGWIIAIFMYFRFTMNAFEMLQYFFHFYLIVCFIIRCSFLWWIDCVTYSAGRLKGLVIFRKVTATGHVLLMLYIL